MAKKKTPEQKARELEERAQKARERMDEQLARKREEYGDFNPNAEYVERIKKNLGRPSIYHESYCQIVIDAMSTGGSIAAAAVAIGVPRERLFRWAEEHEEFRHALQTGTDLAQKYWEQLAMDMGNGIASKCKVKSKGNPSMVTFMMSRRFKDYYKRIETETKSEVKHEIKVFETQLVDGAVRQSVKQIEERMTDIVDSLSEELCPTPE